MKDIAIKTFVLFLLLLPLCAARSQSLVSQIPENESDTSIVRYWKDDISIVYTLNKKSEFLDKYFLLVDEASSVVLRIDVPQEATVNDFRILHDSVFLCGNYMLAGAPQGLLACFAIQDFYNGAGNYRWMVTQQTDMYDCGYDPLLGGGYCQNQITDILRLAVYDSSGYTKMAYIAKNYVDVPTDSRIGVGCATYWGGSWDNIIIYNKHGKEDYTDIIATQNYVVAVARNNVDSLLALRIYPKSSFLTPTWVTISPNPWAYYAITTGQKLLDLKVDDAVMATALDNDEFAVAYHYTDSPQEGLAVKTFDISGGLATLQQALNAQVVRQPTSIWKMRDIRYSPTLQQLMVLNDFDGGIGSQASIVYQFPFPTLATGTYYGRYLPGYNFLALDIFGNASDAFVASGNKTNIGPLTLFWERLMHPTSCGQQDAIGCVKTTAKLNDPAMATNMNEPIPFSGDTPFIVKDIHRDLICNN
ncbi:MAG: hypothetical protein IKG81_06230 [Bacteroidales bacterium]|nr:hypothetical protein [Bacteroidales bacterium]